jgi:FixJ family two-component response regulator
MQKEPSEGPFVLNSKLLGQPRLNTVQLFATAEAFLACAAAQNTRCLISDIQMPGLSRIQMYDQLCAQGTRLPITVITGYQGSPPQISAQ